MLRGVEDGICDRELAIHPEPQKPHTLNLRSLRALGVEGGGGSDLPLRTYSEPEMRNLGFRGLGHRGFGVKQGYDVPTLWLLLQ